jgi:uncharacterized RDD family membrane protein YckC
MKELGWKGFAQSLKRLSAAGRQKLLKLKFRWRGFISRLKEAVIDGWTMFGLLFLLFALSEKLLPFCTLFLLVFLLGLATFVSGVALPIQANFFARLVAQTL